MAYRVETDRKYTITHEWVELEGGIAVVGVTDYAQQNLSDLVYVELPDVGEHLDKGMVLASLESVKAVGEIYAPLSGQIIAANGDLLEHPEWINQHPFGRGWLAKILPAHLEELNDLMDAAAYEDIWKQCHD